MFETIQNKLREIEEQENVTVLFASESGSPDPVLHDFIREKMEHCEKFAQQLEKKETDVTRLNALFRKITGL